MRDLIEGVFSEKDTSKNKIDGIETNSEIKSESDLLVEMKRVEKQMREAAKNLEFEKAAKYRDALKDLKDKFLSGSFS